MIVAARRSLLRSVFPPAIPPRTRFLICMVLALLAGKYAHVVATHDPHHRDLAQLWFAAREILNGRNPYATIRPGPVF